MKEMVQRATCVVDLGGDPECMPHKVEVWVQRLGRWWRWLPRPCYKKVAVFGFDWKELRVARQAYTSLPADMDLARVVKASAKPGAALVKMVLKYTYGKAVTTTPAAEFLQRLGPKGPEGFVLQLSVGRTNTEAAQQEQDRNAAGKNGQGQGQAEGEARCVTKKWKCQCPSCVPMLPFWRLMRACDWAPLPVKPPTAMDTYVDILSAECTTMKTEGDLLLKARRSCKSELAALMAEMDRMEREIDRAEDSWASIVMDHGEPAE